MNEFLSGQMTSETVAGVKYVKKYPVMCNEILETHTTLLEMPVPDTDYEKQKSLFAQKTN